MRNRIRLILFAAVICLGVSLTAPRALAQATLRIPLAGNLYLYVSNNSTGGIEGVDAGNDCVSKSAPCLTLQHAVDQAVTNYDLKGYTLHIQLADGTYYAGFVLSGEVVGAAAGVNANESIIINGDGANPGNVVINDISGRSGVIIVNGNVGVGVDGMAITSATGSALFASHGAQIVVMGSMIFGPTHFGQLHAESSGQILIAGSYTIAGSAPAHLQAVVAGEILYDESPITVTVFGTPAWSIGFADVEQDSMVYVPYDFINFSGGATGPKFKITSNGSIETNNGTPTDFPGSSPGVLLTGGVYDPYPAPTGLSNVTGLGSGNASIYKGSTDKAGYILLTAGSGASAIGTFQLNFATSSVLTRSCTFFPNVGTGIWQPKTTITGGGMTGTTEVVEWDNVDTLLTVGATYFITYTCNAD